MKISNTIILKSIALVALGCATACQTNTAVTNTTNTTANSANAARTENNTANKPVAPPVASKETEKPPTTSLATPTDVYKFAYKARKNKDVEGLKKVMSKDIIEFMTMMSEDDKPDKAILQMTETPQAATDESRNEKVSGETATLEYPDADGKWKTMDFVRENGEWKMTIPTPGTSGGKK